MGLFDFARDQLSSVTDLLPADLADQALSIGEQATGADLSGIAESIGQGQGVTDIAGEAATGALEGTAAEPVSQALEGFLP